MMQDKGVLFVDDEALALKYFRRAFESRFKVFAASSADEALRVLEESHEDIGVIVTDQRMPEASGVELLRIVRQKYPRTVRILTTAYSELDLLIQAINTGAVYSFVTKPWQLDDLDRTLSRALEHYESEVRNHRLLEQKLEAFQTMVMEGRTYDVALIAAKMGHYVNNALCPITLIIDQLLENDGDENLSMEFLTSVRVHVQEISRTLKDLAQSSLRPEPREFQNLKIEDIVSRALTGTEILRREKAIRVDFTPSGNIPPIKGVPTQIERLIRFMITEEAVSLPPNSRFKLNLRPGMDEDGIEGAILEFEDFDPVRAGATPSSLLEPFSVRGVNPREFGIFLASSYLIADHHGGFLKVEIKPDGSLLFTVFLPGADAKDIDKRELRRFTAGRALG
jgi:FixJ family two-component response regulator